MLKQIIKSIRKKPNAVKNQYAFVIASICTALVALVWVPGMFSASDQLQTTEFEPLTEESAGLGDMVNEIRTEFGALTTGSETEAEDLTADPAQTEPDDETVFESEVTSLPATTSVTAQRNEVRIATYTASTTP